jgi:hypothetical protein
MKDGSESCWKSFSQGERPGLAPGRQDPLREHHEATQAPECLTHGDLLSDIQRWVKASDGIERLPCAKEKATVGHPKEAAVGIRQGGGQPSPNRDGGVKPGEAPPADSSLADRLQGCSQQAIRDRSVGIHEDQQIPPCGMRPRVTRGRDLPMAHMDRSVGQLFRDLSGPVGGTVVGDHNLESRAQRLGRLSDAP